MNVESLTAPRWAVSTRSHGEVLTAGVRGPELELLLLGVPGGFSPREIEGWLTDLAGVARETSRSDERERAIPALMHHTLTGLLFSQTEIWSQLPGGGPCSVAFVDGAGGPAFGWVGEGTAFAWVNGDEFHPQWVRVRDQNGREGRAAAFPPEGRVQVVLEWAAPDGSGVTIEAEWPVTPAPAASAPPASAPVAQPIAEPPVAPVTGVFAVRSSSTHAPLPASLPVDQPGLAGDPAIRAEAPADPATPSPFVSQSPGPAAEPSVTPSIPASSSPAEPPHPVQKWLSKMMSWGPKPEVEPEPEARPAREPIFPPAAASAPPSAPSPPPVAEPVAIFRDIAPDAPPVLPTPTASVPAVAPASQEPPATSPPGLAAIGPPSFQTPILGEAHSPKPPVLRVPTPAPPPRSSYDDLLAETAAPAAPAAPTVEPRSAAAPPAPLAPEPPRTPPVLRRPGPVEVTHEPVGAHESFAIAPAPGTPPAPRPTARPEPVLDPATLPPVQLTPYTGTLAEPEPDPNAVDLSTPVRRTPRRAWPIAEETPPPAPSALKRFGPWGALVLALAAAGWWIGHLPAGESRQAGKSTPGILKLIGLGGPSYRVNVTSEPAGAWISVDGKDVAQRTPATIDVSPGAHEITLTLDKLGSATETVKGERGEDAKLAVPLAGGLEVVSADPDLPVSVAVDGKDMGFAPVQIESIEPGLHELTFTGPGMPAWAQTVQVNVRETAQVIARPMTSPSTGVVQVQATQSDESGSAPLPGAQVYVDGELRGTTPTSLELSRGPHSIRVVHRGQAAPVQVIDLPGGNQRFATFSFGLEEAPPTLDVLSPPRPRGANSTATVSAEIRGLQTADVSEAWLHVRSAEGLWRRYSVAPLKGPYGVVLVAVFPPGSFDSSGRAKWYMSAQTRQGDEFYSEIQTASP